MHLARCLAFIKAKFDLTIVASHIQGAKNTLADALSRDNLALFCSLHPQANQNPTAIPEALLHLLIISKPDWTSKRWTDLWNAIFSNGLASSSKRAYNSAKKRYATFCNDKGLKPLPATEHQLCQFSSYSADEKLS